MSATIARDRIEKDAAQAGDWLHYRYTFERWGMKDSSVTTRRVVARVLDAKGAFSHYLVEGNYSVTLKEVISVIPAHESQDADTFEIPQSEIGNSQSKDFPLESGQ